MDYISTLLLFTSESLILGNSDSLKLGNSEAMMLGILYIFLHKITSFGLSKFTGFTLYIGGIFSFFYTEYTKYVVSFKLFKYLLVFITCLAKFIIQLRA